MANGLAAWSGTWLEHDLKIGDEEIWERGMWIDLSVWAKKNEDICAPCGCSQKGHLNRRF